jgi:hypothetical protein
VAALCSAGYVVMCALDWARIRRMGGDGQGKINKSKKSLLFSRKYDIVITTVGMMHANFRKWPELGRELEVHHHGNNRISLFHTKDHRLH